MGEIAKALPTFLCPKQSLNFNQNNELLRPRLTFDHLAYHR